MTDSEGAAVIASFNGDGDALRTFLMRAAHETVIVLGPEDDEARRIVHEARFDGLPVFTLEHPRRPRFSQLQGDLAVNAAHLLGAAWIVPLRLDETFDVEANPAQRGGLRGADLRTRTPGAPVEPAGDLLAVVSTVTLPGPAHKERQSVRLRSGCPRSMLLHLHAPRGSREVRIEIAGLGPAVVGVSELRLFRAGQVPQRMPLAAAPQWLRIAGFAAAPAAALRAMLPAGAMTLIVDLEELAAETETRWDALEVTMSATTAHVDYLLSTAGLAAMTAAFRDPWHVAGGLTELVTPSGA